MGFIVTLILGLFSSLIISNFSGAQAKGRDTERKSDVNSIYQKLEEHFNEHGQYPNAELLENNGEQTLSGIDPEAFLDPDGVKIGNSNSYIYDPSNCTNSGCEKYSLYVELEDGTLYKKESLN